LLQQVIDLVELGFLMAARGLTIGLIFAQCVRHLLGEAVIVARQLRSHLLKMSDEPLDRLLVQFGA
jgi:hypothetical protein